MPDVFISYKKEDVARAEPIARLLAESGYEVWWDHRIPPGRSYREVIGAALQQAKCVVVLWSELSASAQWVLDEADEGKRRNVLLPVMIDAVEIPYGSRQIEAASLVGWNGQASAPQWQNFIEGIAHFVGRPPGGEAKAFITPSAAIQSPPVAPPAPAPARSGGGAGLLIAGVLGVAVLAGGGYFVWQSGMLDGASRTAEADPATGEAPDAAEVTAPVETSEAAAPETAGAEAPVEPAPATTPPPVSPDLTRDVVQVNFDGGNFRLEGSGVWVESSGVRWIEVSRDADTILLKDDTRNAQARFELAEGWIYLYFPDWGEFKRQWPIGSAIRSE